MPLQASTVLINAKDVAADEITTSIVLSGPIDTVNGKDVTSTPLLTFTLDTADLTDSSFFFEWVVEYAKDIQGATDDKLVWFEDCRASFQGDPSIIKNDTKGLGGNPSITSWRPEFVGARVRVRVIPSRPFKVSLQAS